MLDAIVNATSWFVNLFSVAGQIRYNKLRKLKMAKK